MAIEFINVNKLSEEELANYEQGVAFIKGIENPFKLRPSKVVELVSKEIPEFNIALHTKCWKFYDARPRVIERNYKGEYSGFVEGFEGYLYSLQWTKFLVKELKDPKKIQQVKLQAI